MALPTGITTTTITFGTAVTQISARNLSMTVKFTPTTSLVWAATGTVLIADTAGFTADPGAQGSVTLINPDQAGFTDGNGRTIRNWGYKAEASYSDGKTVLFEAPAKYITWTAGDTGPIDLDQMIPVTASSGITVSMPLVTSVNGQTGDVITSGGGGSTDAYLSKSKTPIATRLAGTLIGFAGDSITQGTGASTTSNIYVTQTEKILGAHASRSSINAGVAGERSDQILARIDGVIASGAQFLHVLAGTNDAGQSIPLASYQANIRAIKAKADAAGLPIVFSLVPPRSAAQGSTLAGYVRQYNLWLRFWGNTNGVPIVDTYKALADPATGYLAAVNDSGDGVHPSDAGHAAIAAALAAVLLPLLPLPSWPVVAAGQGLCTDPLMTNRSGTWPAWSISAGPQFPSLSLVPSVNGDLPAGGWLRFTLSNGASGGQSSVSCQLNPTGWAAGDVLLICAYFRASSVEASPKVQLANQNGASVMVLADPAPTATPGPILALYTVPTSGTPTDLALQLVIKSRPGQTDTIDVGAADVFNLTRLGLADGSITV